MLIVIGMHEGDASPSLWRYWADLKTSRAQLKERVEGKLLDLAVLRVRGELQLQPAKCTGLDPCTTISEVKEVTLRVGEVEALRISRQAPTTQDTIMVLGWPMKGTGEVTIHVSKEDGILCLSARDDSLIKTRPFIHAGSSGGPLLLNEQYELIGIVSHNLGWLPPRDRVANEIGWLPIIRSTLTAAT